MRVVAFVHYYVPFRNCGAETMIHRMLRTLREAGHEVRVYVSDQPEAPPRYTYEGIEVFSVNASMFHREIKRYKPDVLIGQQYESEHVSIAGQRLGIPSVMVVHSGPGTKHSNYIARILKNRKFDLVVFNTNWIVDTLPRVPHSMVLHPPVIAEEHRTTRGDSVTLVNLCEDKGVRTFNELAERMPNLSFLGVEGGYGPQTYKDLPNLDFVYQTDNMRDDVWSRTRVLLMPSVYESYGLAGTEALASGIPVLAHPTPGLMESLGPAGIFIDRDDVDAWQHTLERLQDPEEYRLASARATARSNELDPSQELNDWVTRIEELTR